MKTYNITIEVSQLNILIVLLYKRAGRAFEHCLLTTGFDLIPEHDAQAENVCKRYLSGVQNKHL